MKANIQKEFKLMASIFKIGVVGFGGGTALIRMLLSPVSLREHFL